MGSFTTCFTTTMASLTASHVRLQIISQFIVCNINELSVIRHYISLHINLPPPPSITTHGAHRALLPWYDTSLLSARAETGLLRCARGGESCTSINYLLWEKGRQQGGEEALSIDFIKREGSGGLRPPSFSLLRRAGRALRALLGTSGPILSSSIQKYTYNICISK